MHSIHLALCVFVSGHVHCMPTLVAGPLQSSAPSVSGAFPVDCDSFGYGQGLLPSDCKTAIRKLPTDQPGDVRVDLQRHRTIYPEFSYIAPEDRHRLPIFDEVGTCGVRVCTSAFDVKDRSSWRIIRLRFMDILRDCVEFGAAGFGGSTITGQNKYLELTLYSTNDKITSPSNVSLIVSNSTISVAR